MSGVSGSEELLQPACRRAAARVLQMPVSPETTPPPEREWRRVVSRIVGILAGLATHVLFAITVWYLFWFLKGDWQGPAGSLWSNVGLALQFAVAHSALLHPRVRSRLSRWIGAPFYGLFFTAVTCVGLLLTFAGWHSQPMVLWDLHGPSRWGMQLGFCASWLALFYSLSLSGLGYQTGWTPWWAWVRRRPLPRRAFEERSLYRWFRHPIYVSFLGLIWFTPQMTLDHAVLTGIWSVYIFVGSWLKDRRLEHFLGDTYREYESRVPGYPGLRSGPLGLRSWKPIVVEPHTRRRAA